MPRYLVERSFPVASAVTAGAEAATAWRHAVETQLREGVIWIHSYVTPDGRRSYCIFDGPSPEAIRIAAGAAGWPVDRITEVRVIDPYVHH
jgi:hypothetical protein